MGNILAVSGQFMNYELLFASPQGKAGKLRLYSTNKCL